MIEGRHKLDTLVTQASTNARASQRSVLVSVVERVAASDPLSALHSVARLTSSDTTLAAHTADRMYWSRPVDNFALAAVGATVTFTPKAHGSADRFAMIDREWSQLIDEAMVDDASGGAAGAGPMLLGGFAFEPTGPRTGTWRDFPAARMIMPRLLLAATPTGCWLTTNVVVGPTGQPDIEPALLERLTHALLDGATEADDRIAPTPDDGVFVCVDVRDPVEWRTTVRDAVAAIHAGKFEKVVLAREVRGAVPDELDIVQTLRRLRSAHPTCYVFGCWHGHSAFLGATPERLVRLDGRDVQASSLAGSVRRGATAKEDSAHAQSLLDSAKDRSEHEIVRQALCTGLARLCDDIAAPQEPVLLSLPQVHHLHTQVRARLRAGHTLLQLVAELHPTPAVGGAPRGAALRFTREHEGMDRGWYAAPIGWLQRDHGEFAVALRSALICDEQALLFAGCGVVADSDPDQEYAESLLKLLPMQAALATSMNNEQDMTDVANDSLVGVEASSGGAGRRS